jgi:tetratricopeptide (TPR) repeat protein
MGSTIRQGERKSCGSRSLYRDGLQMFENSRAANASEIAVALHGLGALCAVRGRLQEAESYLSEAVAIKTDMLGSRHADVAMTLNNLAFVYGRRGDVARAGAMYLLALEIFTDALGEAHPKTIACRENGRHRNRPRPERRPSGASETRVGSP